MDLNTITVILAIITIIPTIGGLIIQARQQARQALIDQQKADSDERKSDSDIKSIEVANSQATISATLAVIQPLRDELSRLQQMGALCQTRIMELETALIEKTKQYGLLMQDNIDKDSELRTLKYKMGEMQVKLEEVIPPSKRKKEDTVPLEVKKQITANEEKKSLIIQEVDREIEVLKSGSIAFVNGKNEVNPCTTNEIGE